MLDRISRSGAPARAAPDATEDRPLGVLEIVELFRNGGGSCAADQVSKVWCSVERRGDELPAARCGRLQRNAGGLAALDTIRSSSTCG
jgi:hypothetical protein